MTQITLKTAWERVQVLAYPRFLRTAFTNLNTMLTEIYAANTTDAADVVLTFPVSLHASKVIYNVFHAKRGYTVTAISWITDIAQVKTITVVKATGTTAPAAATTPMHIADAIDCNRTAHDPQTVTLTVTAADLVLAAGNRIGIVLNAALTTGSGTLVIRMSRT